MSSQPVPVADLVPHGRPALLIETVSALHEDGIDCVGAIPGDFALAREGLAPAFVGLEMAAQAAAIYEVLHRGAEDAGCARRVGFLVSLRDVRLEQPDLPVGVRLVASVRSLGGVGSLGLYEARIDLDGSTVVRGTIGTFVPAADGPGTRLSR
jgi:predicted hotdog family 3-hydroxylacyl-ACP dehydratase